MLGDYKDTCDPQLRIIIEHETMHYLYSSQHITFLPVVSSVCFRQL